MTALSFTRLRARWRRRWSPACIEISNTDRLVLQGARIRMTHRHGVGVRVNGGCNDMVIRDCFIEGPGPRPRPPRPRDVLAAIAILAVVGRL